MDSKDELTDAIKQLIGINFDKYYTITRCQSFEGKTATFGIRC